MRSTNKNCKNRYRSLLLKAYKREAISYYQKISCDPFSNYELLETMNYNKIDIK